MRTILTICMTMLIATVSVLANNEMSTDPADTVMIKLENGTEIIIYTRNRTELKRIQTYDINKMVKDLNGILGDSDVVEYIELENLDGEKYLIDSPTVVFEKEDTIIVYKESFDNILIRLKGMELDLDPNEIEYEFDNGLNLKRHSYIEENSPRTRHSLNIDIGLSSWLTKSTPPRESNLPYIVKPWGSWNVGLNWITKTPIKGLLSLEWGGGISWANWKLENPDVMINKGVNQIEFNQSPNTIRGKKSKLTATHINISLVPMLDFGRGSKRVKETKGRSFTFKFSKKSGFRIGAGVYGGYRISSRTKFIFKEDGRRKKTKESGHFYLRNFRYGLRGQLGFRGFDMFVLYDLSEVFVLGRGPNGTALNAFTVGVTL